MALAARHGTAAAASGPVGRSRRGAAGPVWSQPGRAVGRFLGGPAEFRAGPTGGALRPPAGDVGSPACAAGPPACDAGPATRYVWPAARAVRAPGDTGSGEAGLVRSRRKWAVGRFLGGPGEFRAGAAARRATKR
jgi:hypothetical protein